MRKAKERTGVPGLARRGPSAVLAFWVMAGFLWTTGSVLRAQCNFASTGLCAEYGLPGQFNPRKPCYSSTLYAPPSSNPAKEPNFQLFLNGSCLPTAWLTTPYKIYQTDNPDTGQWVQIANQVNGGSNTLLLGVYPRCMYYKAVAYKAPAADSYSIIGMNNTCSTGLSSIYNCSNIVAVCPEQNTTTTTSSTTTSTSTTRTTTTTSTSTTRTTTTISTSTTRITTTTSTSSTRITTTTSTSTTQITTTTSTSTTRTTTTTSTSTTRTTTSTSTSTTTSTIAPTVQLAVANQANPPAQPTLVVTASAALNCTVELRFVIHSSANQTRWDAALYPLVVFSSSNSKVATFSFADTRSQSQPFQQGNVAGTITAILTSMNGSPIIGNVVPLTTVAVPLMAPVITDRKVTVNSTRTGFTVEVTGFTTTRELRRARIDFSQAAGYQLGGDTSVQPDLTSMANTYFSDSGPAVGGSFKYIQGFTYSGDWGAISGATVTLTNGSGDSASASIPFTGVQQLSQAGKASRIEIGGKRITPVR